MKIIWVWFCVCVRKNRTQKYAVVDNSFTCDMDVKAVWDNGGVLILTSRWLEFPLKFQLIQLFKECIELCMLLKHGNSAHFNYFLTNFIHTWHSMLLVYCVQPFIQGFNNWIPAKTKRMYFLNATHLMVIKITTIMVHRQTLTDLSTFWLISCKGFSTF